MKKVILAISTIILIISCTKDFEEINENNNQPESASGALLLPTVIFDYADLMVNQNYDFGNTVGQYTANYEFNDIDLFDWTSDDRFWAIYSSLQNIKDIEAFATRTNSPNYEAIACILRAYGISILTDVYGDVPYLGATAAEAGNFNPSYDTQEDIYNGIMDELKRASELIDESDNVDGDILFNGDMSKWKKFANSLRLRLLLRSSSVQDNTAAMSEILNNPAAYPVFESNSDNAIYQYSGNIPDVSPYSSGRGRAYDYYLGIPTSHLIETLKGLDDDPRMNEWFDPQESTNDFLGTDPGQTIGNVGRPDDFASKAASYFNTSDKIGGIFMTYSELCFILAEAVEKGYISGDAKVYYDKAVQASFDQWDVAMPSDYLISTAPYSNTNEVLATQKWLSLYQNSLQGWLCWKRTGLPSFIQAGPGTVNGGEVPVRLMYPALEQSVNTSNYQSASSHIGGDNINSRVWWDK